MNTYQWFLSLMVLGVSAGNFGLSSTALAQANEVECDSLASCRQLEAQVRERLDRIQSLIQKLNGSSSVALGDLQLSDDGSRRLTYDEAKRICHRQRSRLPTIRELALHFESQGAQGIRETAHPGIHRQDPLVRDEIEQMALNGYRPVYKKTGTRAVVVDFYFNADGYRRPIGDFGSYFFWSSTEHPVTIGAAYLMNGNEGDVGAGYRTDRDAAVRCVAPILN